MMDDECRRYLEDLDLGIWHCICIKRGSYDAVDMTVLVADVVDAAGCGHWIYIRHGDDWKAVFEPRACGQMIFCERIAGHGYEEEQDE